MMELAAAVAAQRELAEALFDQLREDILHDPSNNLTPRSPCHFKVGPISEYEPMIGTR